jgi:hypothetical protein
MRTTDDGRRTTDDGRMSLDLRFLAIASRCVEIPDADDAFRWRILADYGAVFTTVATPPPCIAFASATEVDRFQESLDVASAPFDGVAVTLQRPALDALRFAAEEASALGVRVGPRGSDASARSWADSEALWRGRVERATAHWLESGCLLPAQAERLLGLPLDRQIVAVLDLECDEIWFSTYFDKSILYSVAAPGTSQHLSMLAFDVEEYADPTVRQVLAEHGWFQTVVSDLPHFTFLGRTESELPELGLRRVTQSFRDQEYVYWVPARE